MPSLSLQECNAHRAFPEGVVHYRVAGHAGNAIQDELDVAFDVVPAGPDGDSIRKLLVLVFAGGPPQVELRADPLNIGGENSDIVALPFAVVEGYGLWRSPPFDGQCTPPHSAGVFVSN